MFIMKVYRLDSFTGIDALTLHDEPTPEVGRGQVRVRVRASSLNYRDLVLAEGKYPFPARERTIPHSDAAGEIEAVGADVRRFEVGDRVMNYFFANWVGGVRRRVPEQYMVDHDGWLAEYRVVDAEALVAMPAHLSFEEAASVPCAGVTAWNAVAGVRPGRTVVTQGTGGVSLFALQFAMLLGARVIATTSTAQKEARLRDLGADEVIDSVATPDWARVVRELTDGDGADRIVDLGGPASLEQSAAAVAQRGQVSLVGALGTGAPIDFFKLFLSQARYETIGVGSRSDTEEMNRAIAATRLRPVLDRVFELHEAKAAWQHFAKRNVFGKVVVRH
jgi:NADPH:quinone reductase-like Zn-dependent oxidoreductase